MIEMEFISQLCKIKFSVIRLNGALEGGVIRSIISA